MPKIILGLVGQLASGKDSAKKYLIENYGASGHRFSSMLRDVLNRLYIPVSRHNLQDLSLILRQKFGEDALARVIAEEVKEDTREIVIVDGVRRLEDIAYLKSIPGFHLLSLEVKPEIRYERMVKRNENAGDAEKSYDDFLADGAREAELEIPKVMESADYHVDNNGSIADLKKQLDKIIEEIEKK